MGTIQANFQTLENEVVEKVTTNFENKCLVNVRENFNGNVVVVNGTKVNGNFVGIMNKVSVDSSCQLMNSMEEYVEATLDNIAKASSKTQHDMFNGFTFSGQDNEADLVDRITTNITNTISNTCNFKKSTSFVGNTVFVTDSVTNNFIGITNTSDAHSTCAIHNFAKSQATGKASNDSRQTSTTTGMFVGIVVAIVVAFAMIIIFFTFMLLKNTRNNTTTKQKYNHTNDGDDSNDGDDMRDELFDSDVFEPHFDMNDDL
ncbi:MAG: hypothetical protein K0U78_02850 [Actinomycetia bacterium]|nr:hypothetical protein [Actinomycetes bacterium]